MAITDVVTRVYSAMLLNGVKQVTPFVGLAVDKSSEIVSEGTGLRVPIGMDSINVGDYVKGTPITTVGAVPKHADLNVDKQKYFAALVEDIDETQTNFSLMSDSAAAGARSLASQIASDFRTAIASATYPAAQKSDITLATADTIADADIVSLQGAMVDLVGYLRSLGYNQRPFAILPRALWKSLLLYYTGGKGNQDASPLAENSFRDAALSGVYGCDIIVDWGMTATADPYNIYAGISQRSYMYAQQVSVTESYRSSDQFATIIRGLLTYGVGVQDARTIYNIKLDK